MSFLHRYLVPVGILPVVSRSLSLGVGRKRKTHPMLCEKCSLQEATVFTTRIIGGVTHCTNACDTCYRSSAPASEAEEVDSLRLAQCTFCQSGLCVTRLPNVLPLLDDKKRFICRECLLEWSKFIKAHFDSPFSKDPMPAVQVVSEDAERHMQEWLDKK